MAATQGLTNRAQTWQGVRAAMTRQRWYGAHPGAELVVQRHPRAVLDGIAAGVDDLHSWQGGGVVFGRKPYLGQVERTRFRVRPLSFRRDGASGFLVGEVEASEQGTIVRYRIESPVGFVRSLPVAAAAPAALFGIGGYLAAPAYASDTIARTGIVVACGVFGLLIAGLLIALVLRGLRRDTHRLLEFVRNNIQDAS